MFLVVCQRIGVLSVFFFKQKTAYEMRISDWSSDVCSSDLTGYARAFWEYRLMSIAITIVSVLGTMLIFTLQVLFASFEELILSFFPLADNVAGWLGLSRIAQAIVLFPALYGLFYSLTPHRYRARKRIRLNSRHSCASRL